MTTDSGIATRRWVGVGASDDVDAGRAGTEAVRAAVQGTDPALVLVFASDRFAHAELARAVADNAPGVPMIGCSTAGEIAAGGPSQHSVVAVALGGNGLEVSTRAVRDISGRLRDAGAEAAACVREVAPRAHRVLLLLTDGLAGDQEEIVRGAYSEVGAEVPLVGGCAGDDQAMRRTVQYHDGEVLTDAIVAAAISSDGPLGIGVSHGWRRVGDPVLVTHSTSTEVFSLDDEPAFDVYCRRLDVPEDARTDAAAFTQFAATHPLGISRRGSDEVRFISGADLERRSLRCIAQVPQGGLAWFMEGDDRSVLDATDEACASALAAMDGEPPLGLVAFDCIARYGVLGSGVTDEVAAISRRAGDAPIAGFYTYGEIARTTGITGFHNQTLVVLAVG